MTIITDCSWCGQKIRVAAHYVPSAATIATCSPMCASIEEQFRRTYTDNNIEAANPGGLWLKEAIGWKGCSP